MTSSISLDDLLDVDFVIEAVPVGSERDIIPHHV